MQVGFLMTVLLSVTTAFAADQEGGTVIRETPIYVSPDASAQKVGTASRGRDIELVAERSTIDRKPWARVLAQVEAGRRCNESTRRSVFTRPAVNPPPR